MFTPAPNEKCYFLIVLIPGHAYLLSIASIFAALSNTLPLAINLKLVEYCLLICLIMNRVYCLLLRALYRTTLGYFILVPHSNAIIVWSLNRYFFILYWSAVLCLSQSFCKQWLELPIRETPAARRFFSLSEATQIGWVLLAALRSKNLCAIRHGTFVRYELAFAFPPLVARHASFSSLSSSDLTRFFFFS